MKKLCFLAAVFLLLSGCGKESAPLRTATTVHETETVSEDLETPYVKVDIYAINDLHGRLVDTDQQSGVDGLSTYLKEVRQTENAIFLSVGDMWQGTSESNLTKGLIVTEWMNEMGFAAMTLGGHEYDWGEQWIRQNEELAEFPFLGINVYSRETDSRVDYCRSSLVVDIEGVQIGVIGAIGDCYYAIGAEHTKDVYFQTGSQLTALVKAESEKLRGEGVDFIIYTIHDGYDKNTSDTQALSVTGRELAGYYDTTLSDGYVDLVFEADSHYWYLLEDEHGVYHMQGGANNKGLSYASVMIDKTSGDAYVVGSELLPDSHYRYMEADPVMENLLEKYAEQIAPSARLAGTNGYYRNGQTICQLVADLYCSKGAEKWGSEYNIVLGGGYISCRSPGYLPAGEVYYSQLQSLLPFDNPITLCCIRGRDLLSKFLETENPAYYIKTTDYGESIRHNIDPDATYYVVTDSYSAYYSYNNMTVIDIYDENTFARDLLADYIAEGNLQIGCCS